MNEPLENLYFNWLCAKVITVVKTTPRPMDLRLLRILHNTEFVWLLSGDDNRAEDGKELRREFLIEADIPDDILWRTMGCSMLEMLIAFARRAEFQTDDPAREWFWEFIENLGLREFADDSNAVAIIQDKLDTVIWRTYDWHGYGGIFPIIHPQTDQRELEIWYQFCNYLVDQDRLP